MGRQDERLWHLAFTLLGFLLALLGLLPAPLWAAEVYRNDQDEIGVRLDTTLSMGVSLRAENRDRGLIWIGHGGTNTNAAAINSDDGDLNHDQWDVFSTLTKATSELEASWGNYTAFVRGTAFWDPIANCNGTGAGAPNQPGFDEPECTRRTPLDDAARHRPNYYEGGVVGAHLQLLDAYLEADWELFERPVDVRLGNQLISWGTSFYYQGINQINPADVTKLRVPGSEIKEALLPSPMVRLQTELFQNVGLDAYYQFYWNRTHLDPTGSYFSSSDLLGRGASLPASGDGSLQGFYLPNLLLESTRFDPADPGGTGLTPEQLIFAAGIPRVGGIPRLSDDEPRDQGQAGVSLRYFHEPAQTELGLYYVHFHSKTPVLGFDARSFPAPLPAENSPWAYFAQYPDDIDLVGASVATQIMGAAVTGEVSYRPNDPVPIASLVGPQVPSSFVFDPDPAVTRLAGFEREQRLQFVVNLLASIAPGTQWVGPIVQWIGADDLIFLAESGLVAYPDLDRFCLPVGEVGPPAAQRVSTVQTGCTPYAGPPGTSDSVDDVSWGYQLRIGPNYYSPLGLPVRFQPFVSWQHDVDGTTPGFNPYLDERMAVDLGFEVVYLDAWTTRISYAAFFGGGNANLINDRDFLSMSLSYAF